MLRYVIESDFSVFLSNDKDINMIQDRNPVTGEKFTDKETAVAWVTDYAAVMNETLIESEVPITQESELTKQIESLVADNETLKADNELLKGCVMELAAIIYS